MSRSRPRISLLTALLLMTVVGLAIVVAQLWREVEPLRLQLRQMRTELGLLNIQDSSQIHVIQVGTGEFDHWRWRIYLPPGRTYELCCYDGVIPPRKAGTNNVWFQQVKSDCSGMTGTVQAGEFVLDVKLEKRDDRWFLTTSRSNGQDLGSTSIMGDWLSDNSHMMTSATGLDSQTTLPPNEPLLLMKMLAPVVTKQGSSVSRTTPTGPAEGIVVWIE